MAGSLTLALLGLTVIPALTTLPRYYSQTIFASVNQAREFSSYLQATASPGALVIVNLPPSDPYFQYYDPGIETLFISDATPEGREADEKRLDQALTDHREIWLVPFRYGSPEYHYVERDLSQRAFKADERWFGNIQLVRYIRPADQASLRHDLPFEFDQPFGKIRLLGYSLSPEEPRPGQNITLRLFWGASGPTRSPLKVFVHLDDSTGKTVAQSDAQPSTGSRPTTGWGSGEEIADNHALGLSAELPAGEYALVVGMYDESSGERLILADGQNSAKIATVSIR